MALGFGPKFVTTGLVAYYDAANIRSYPGTGTVITDLTRNKINGTLSNVTYSTSGIGSLNFNGSTSYINYATSSNLTLGTNDFTIDMWFNTTARTQTYPTLLHNEVGSTWTTNSWQINDRHNNNATKATLWVYNHSSATALLVSSTAIQNGVWYNLIISRVGTSFSMYINGNLDVTATSSASIDGGVSKTYGLSSSVAGGQYNGLVPLVKIYNNKGLTAAEVSQNFNATRNRFGV